MENKVRTRFAPSPTGYMHIGNLRTALFAYLYTKSKCGDFILRIEDTDQGRFVEGATDIIYSTLKTAKLAHDEGPDIGGKYGPYTQSERKSIYRKYAEELVANGQAYYCFCDKNEKSDDNNEGYDRHCRDLPLSIVEEYLNEKRPYVIRQKIPLNGTTSWDDMVYGTITVENSTLDDQVLLKSDGMPTYNFANVVDDHLMNITHIIRGSEYLSSNPKYLLLYKAFGWETPKYIHLPLINGKNPDGTVSKLSKRHGAVSFQALVDDGYLPEAIVNYIALLGWSPKTTQEIFSMEELIKEFSVSGIHKNPAVFDYLKLDWVNSQHIAKMELDDFAKLSLDYASIQGTDLEKKWHKVASLLQCRINKFSEISDKIKFLKKLDKYDVNLYVNKKNKSTYESAYNILKASINSLSSVQDWSEDELKMNLTELAENLGVKIGQLYWPIRIAISGLLVTPGGATDILYILGKSTSIDRLNIGLELIDASMRHTFSCE